MTPYYEAPDVTLWQGDALTVLDALDSESVQCVVTSPPFYGLRDYGTARWEGGDTACDHRKVQDAAKAIATSTLWKNGGTKTTGHQQEGYGANCRRCGAIRIDSQIGLEATPADYVTALVAVFEQVRRVLNNDGTVWLNLGDSYAGGGQGNQGGTGQRAGRTFTATRNPQLRKDRQAFRPGNPDKNGGASNRDGLGSMPGFKPKDLLGIPWRVALALQDAGWWLRSDIIWSKPNPMPESVTDRPTRAHEYVFLLSKSERYFYDADAIREPYARLWDETNNAGGAWATGVAEGTVLGRKTNPNCGLVSNTPGKGANKRSVWTINPEPFPEGHFATFPTKLVEPCILAGSRPGDVVLDPFAGSGTTLMVSRRLGRRAIGIELNPTYCRMAVRRIEGQTPMLPFASDATA